MNFAWPNHAAVKYSLKDLSLATISINELKKLVGTEAGNLRSAAPMAAPVFKGTEWQTGVRMQGWL